MNGLAKSRVLNVCTKIYLFSKLGACLVDVTGALSLAMHGLDCEGLLYRVFRPLFDENRDRQLQQWLEVCVTSFRYGFVLNNGDSANVLGALEFVWV